MINPLHVRSFLKLWETRHFTKAAQALNMTQPGISQHLKALEEDLGTPLFTRIGKSIELTPAGEHFYHFAQAHQEAEALLREEISEDSPVKGAVKIACSGTMAMRLYPDLLALQRDHRDLHIHLEAAPDARTIQLVKAGDYAIGLITQQTEDPELNAFSAGSEELCLALPKGSSAQWDDLVKLGFINHPNGAHYATRIFKSNYAEDFTGFKDLPQTGFINQLNQILTPVALGLGFTALPRHTIESFPERQKLTIAELSIPCWEKVFCITKNHKKLPRRYDRVFSQIKAHFLSAKED